jgi:hypothetical protein
MLKHLTILCLLITLAAQSKAQVNLVLNGSFEDITDCPLSYEPIYTAIGWFTPSDGSADLFNACASFNGVPDNPFGYQNAQHGIGYCGGIHYKDQGQYDTRENIAGTLIQPLKQNHYYCFKMFVCLAENSNYFIGSLGAFFSPDSLYIDIFDPLPYQPQIENNETNFITDTTKWKLIEGGFVAEGGERYIYIGNFRNNAQTPALYPPIPPIQGSNRAYIYFDNVQLYECDSLVDIEENLNNPISIYPNPASENVTITLPPNTNKAELLIYTTQGQLLNQTQLNGTQTINTSTLANGLYLFVIQSNGDIIGREKVIIAH